jgi:basic amino acid/polyamine antiporter, APA family
MPPQISADRGPAASRSQLVRILGLGFGIAVIFGGMVGVGILRLPGTVAGQLRSFWLIQLAWIAGGCYALLGAISVAELGAAMPQAGGFYIYARRAFGNAAGFAVGWADWLSNCAVIAYASVTAAEYIAALVPSAAAKQTLVALGLLILFCALHAAGLRLSSSVQKLTSSVTAITFLVLAAACFLHRGAADTGAQDAGLRGGGFLEMLAPMVAAMRAIVVAYDGWYEAIYFTEEDTDAARHLPRAMIGGVLLVIALYLVMNLAYLHVLSIAAMAASTLPAADAARLVLPAGGGRFVTVLSLLTLLSLINAILLGTPRILLAIGRDGLLSERVARVGPRGTPLTAMLLSAAAAAVLIVSGRFEDIIAVAAILVAGLYSVSYVAVITLRAREPAMERPFRAWGYPVTTLVVLAGSLLFLIAAIHDNPNSAARTLWLLAVAAPAYLFMRWRRRRAGLA